MSRDKTLKSFSNIFEDLLTDSQHLYVLIIDLCGSTNYKQKMLELDMSDSHWLGRQLMFLSMTSDYIRTCNGQVIKSMGDAILASFDYNSTAEDIVYDCVEMIRKFNNFKVYTGIDKIEVKISIDFGETINGSITDGNYDPLGLCVDRCARLNNEADANVLTFSNSFNSKLKINDKTSIHENIIKHERQQNNFKGLGKIKYHKLYLL